MSDSSTFLCPNYLDGKWVTPSGKDAVEFYTQRKTTRRWFGFGDGET